MMKKVIMLMTLLALMSCGDDADNTNCTIEGRWLLEGFEQNTLYEFTESLRYTIYSSEEGVFGTIEDAIPGPHDYSIVGDSITIDLNFGNFLIAEPQFKCDCNVVDFVRDSGVSTLFKENHDLSSCD